MTFSFVGSTAIERIVPPLGPSLVQQVPVAELTETVTSTAAATVLLPLSVATAIILRLWLHGVFIVAVYVFPFTVAPVPFTFTDAMPVSVSFTVPVTVKVGVLIIAPLAGLSIVIVGDLRSRMTVRITGLPIFPALSVAWAEMTKGPSCVAIRVAVNVSVVLS